MSLLGEEAEILLNFLIHMLSLSICPRVVCGRKLAINTEFLVQGFDEPRCELRSSIADDALREAMKSEHVVNVEVCNTFSVDLVCGESKVCLFCVQVDVRSDGCVRFPIDPFAWW